MTIKLMRLEKLTRLVALKYYQLNTSSRAENYQMDKIPFLSVHSFYRTSHTFLPLRVDIPVFSNIIKLIARYFLASKPSIIAHREQ